MFDFDASKLIVVGVVALIFIGPKDLPRVLRQLGQMYGKMQKMAAEFKGQLMDAINEADVDGLRKDLAQVTDSARIDLNLNPSPPMISAELAADEHKIGAPTPLGEWPSLPNETLPHDTLPAGPALMAGDTKANLKKVAILKKVARPRKVAVGNADSVAEPAAAKPLKARSTKAKIAKAKPSKAKSTVDTSSEREA